MGLDPWCSSEEYINHVKLCSASALRNDTVTLVESSRVTQCNLQGYLYVALKCIGIIFQSVSKTSETIHWCMVPEVGFKTKPW